jgi:hypothetical protein
LTISRGGPDPASAIRKVARPSLTCRTCGW